MKEDIDISQIANTPVENEVTLLYELATALDILVYDIDQMLSRTGHSFSREKKMQFRAYAKSVKDATYYLDKLGVERALWRAAQENYTVADNCLADAYELIRIIMLYIDRSHNDASFRSIYRHMSNLPQTGIFPDGYINRFEFARPYVYGAGDRVMTELGEAEIMAPGNNDKWVVKLKKDGKQVIVNEDTIKLL